MYSRRLVLHRAGIQKSVRMPVPDPAAASDTHDMARKCSRCRHPCSLGCVICPCSPASAACLRHFEAACRCPARGKVFVFWYSARHDILQSTFSTRTKSLRLHREMAWALIVAQCSAIP